MHQSINASINQYINQSIHQSINASIDQYIDQSIHQSINTSINQYINHYINQSINTSINQYINQSINTSINRYSDQYVSQCIKQSIHHPRKFTVAVIFLFVCLGFLPLEATLPSDSQSDHRGDWWGSADAETKDPLVGALGLVARQRPSRVTYCQGGRKVRRPRATQPSCPDVPDWVTTSDVQ